MRILQFKTSFRVPAMAIVIGLALVTAVPTTAADRPNFLLMVADDLNRNDLGFMGNTDVKTPHLDRLAAEGMTLRGMHTPAPTCSPCRQALYTGLFPVRNGIPKYGYDTLRAPLQAYGGTRSIFTHLKAAGYRVGMLGKTDVGPASAFPWEYLGKDPDQVEPLAAFINRDKSQPWLAVFGSNDPHTGWSRGPKNLYDAAKLKIPPYMQDDAATRKSLVDYYAEITQLDIQVGACLKALQDSGQADNTLVLFVSEQGSSLPYGGKWSFSEDGMRVVGVARWPGKIKPGSVSAALMQYVDVPPTFLAAAGVEPAKIDTGCPDANGFRGFDGRSFLDVLLGKSDKLRDYVFTLYEASDIDGRDKGRYPMRAVSDGHYKLIRNLAAEGGIHGTAIPESWERDTAKDARLQERIRVYLHRMSAGLYDGVADPYNMHNLADDPKFADVKARLARELDAWMAQQGDKDMAERKAKSRQGVGKDEADGAPAK